MMGREGALCGLIWDLWAGSHHNAYACARPNLPDTRCGALQCHPLDVSVSSGYRPGNEMGGRGALVENAFPPKKVQTMNSGPVHQPLLALIRITRFRYPPSEGDPSGS